MIDPATRDIVEDEHAMEVYKKPDGKLGLKVLGTVAQVKDECKELKGRPLRAAVVGFSSPPPGGRRSTAEGGRVG